MAPSLGIELILVAANVAGANPWPISISRFRTDPDQQVALVDLPGKKPEVLIAQDYPGIQVLVRGSKVSNGYELAWNKAKDIFHVLQAVQDPLLAAYPELASCVARHDVLSLGYDEESRPIMSLNFDLIVTPAVVGNRPY